VVDVATARLLMPPKAGSTTTVKLDQSIADDKQSAYLNVSGTIADGSYKTVPGRDPGVNSSGELVFDRTLRGLRNTILLPDGWDVSAASQSGTTGTYQNRAFVS